MIDMDEATLRFFEELPNQLRGLSPRWVVMHFINDLLKKHLPLLQYYEVDPGGLWELRIGGKGE